MNQRTDFWEWYEQLFRTPQVISQEVKAPVSKTGNAGSNPASSANGISAGSSAGRAKGRGFKSRPA